MRRGVWGSRGRPGFAAALSVGIVVNLGCGDAGPEGTSPVAAPELPPPPVDDPPSVSPPRACAPSSVVLRRLNRLEYDHTLRDLLGIEGVPSAAFPADDPAYGFDTVGEGLSLSPLLFEQLERSAERSAREALIARSVEPELRVFEAEEQSATSGRAADGHWYLDPGGTMSVPVEIPVAGEHDVAFRAFGWLAEDAAPRVQLRRDEAVLGEFMVRSDVDQPETFSVRASLPAGPQTLQVVFMPDDGGPRLRSLAVDWVSVHGPFDAAPVRPAGYARWVGCDPAEVGRRSCAAQVLEAFARRAWRRPVTSAEVQELVDLSEVAAAEGDDFDVQIALGMQGILLSPHFVFRVELGQPAPDGGRRLTQHELATRLSYFLWRTTPDEDLLDAADRGLLFDPAELDRQLDRMLSDPRAHELVRDFAGQWLHVRALDASAPDPGEFPGWDDDLRAAMRAETERFVAASLDEGRTIFELLDADFTFLNDRLAAHYGLPLPGSDQLVRYPVDRLTPRGGLLFQGSFLTVTSNPRRTNPVRRGALVLESLLCSAPPPPPPGVEGLPEPAEPTGTLRDRFDQHRSKPECAACHVHIDPLGFPLENFDAIGAWRTTDDGFPIDASGELADGTTFNGPEGLARILAEDPRYPACVVEKLATYAIGRPMTRKDACALGQLEQQTLEQGATLEALIRGLVKSELFTRIGTDEGEGS